jgi:predicted lipid-binding transport protein (Tim44 family)
VATQQSTATALFDAWKSNDRAAASQAATPDVVNRLFAIAWDSADRALGCQQQPSATVICSYAYTDGTLDFYVDQSATSYIVDALGTQP